MRYSFDNIVVFVVLCTGLGIRGIVSLSSYSGAATPPMFGDYEAQRHWQELTYNLQPSQWYLNTENNDLLYWGIDYPPLSAYHSFLLGLVANRINSSYVLLFYSRGYESGEHKSFMRLTVLTADLLVYMPAIALVIFTLKSTTSEYMLSSLMLLVLYPCQILIDNGHFQYNNISLGLFLFSVASLLQNRYNWASFTFTLALNYKQMELYHALPVFIYILKGSFSEKSVLKKMLYLLKVAFITLTTFILLWIPWILSTDSLLAVALRLFPLNRGVFEDKVANVWCSLNALYKLKNKLQNNQMALICLAATLTGIIPTNLHLFLNLKKENFLYTLVNTSLTFFLVAFQVHEKSILLAAVPICFLLKMMPFSVLCFLRVSTFSILPLLIKDNLRINYFCMLINYLIIFKDLIQIVYSKDDKTNKLLIISMHILDIIVVMISLGAVFITPPKRYPYLWPFIISFSSCIFFIIFLVKSNLLQYNNNINSYKYLQILFTKNT